jgi:NADH-quinone oxidoreductase subunit F
VVNNVETLACLPHILTRGLEWWNSLGTENSKGPKMYCVSGPVNRPGCYEAPLGLPLRELIYGDDFAQGMRDGKKVKAVFPGGLSMGVLRGDTFPKAPDDRRSGPGLRRARRRLDFDDVKRYGLMGLGTAAAVIVPEDADMREVLFNVARFYSLESCGQCTQCREGTTWMKKIADRLRQGAGRLYDLDLLEEVGGKMGMMPGMSICGLSDGAGWPVRMIVQKFRRRVRGPHRGPGTRRGGAVDQAGQPGGVRVAAARRPGARPHRGHVQSPPVQKTVHLPGKQLQHTED